MEIYIQHQVVLYVKGLNLSVKICLQQWFRDSLAYYYIIHNWAKFSFPYLCAEFPPCRQKHWYV